MSVLLFARSPKAYEAIPYLSSNPKNINLCNHLSIVDITTKPNGVITNEEINSAIKEEIEKYGLPLIVFDSQVELGIKTLDAISEIYQITEGYSYFIVSKGNASEKRPLQNFSLKVKGGDFRVVPENGPFHHKGILPCYLIADELEFLETPDTRELAEVITSSTDRISYIETKDFIFPKIEDSNNEASLDNVTIGNSYNNSLTSSNSDSSLITCYDSSS